MTGQVGRSRPDQAADRGRAGGLRPAARGSANNSRAQGTAVVPRRELHVHQEQGLRRCGDADPGRWRQHRGYDLRQLRPPRRVVPPASTSSAVRSARTARRTSCWTCGVRAPRSASRSSCSAPATRTRRKTSTCRSRVSRPTSSRWLVSSAVELHYGSGLGTATGPNGFPNDPAFELEYTPYGVGSGLCVGVAWTAAPGRARSASSRVALRRRPSGSWTLSTPPSAAATCR